MVTETVSPSVADALAVVGGELGEGLVRTTPPLEDSSLCIWICKGIPSKSPSFGGGVVTCGPAICSFLFKGCAGSLEEGWLEIDAGPPSGVGVARSEESGDCWSALTVASLAPWSVVLYRETTDQHRTLNILCSGAILNLYKSLYFCDHLYRDCLFPLYRNCQIEIPNYSILLGNLIPINYMGFQWG